MTKSELSLVSEHRFMVNRFGEDYVDFLNNNPTITKRVKPITDIAEAVREGDETLVRVDMRFGDGAIVWWIKVMLIELLRYLGAFERVRPMQVENLAKSIRQEYYWMTPKEFSVFVCKFSLGYYGKLYNSKTVNPQDITIGLRMFADDLKEVRGQIEAEERERKRSKQKMEDKKTAVSWEDYCKMKGLEKKTPFHRLYGRFNIDKNKGSGEER